MKRSLKENRWFWGEGGLSLNHSVLHMCQGFGSIESLLKAKGKKNELRSHRASIGNPGGQRRPTTERAYCSSLCLFFHRFACRRLRWTSTRTSRRCGAQCSSCLSSPLEKHGRTTRPKLYSIATCQLWSSRPFSSSLSCEKHFFREVLLYEC